MLNSEEVVKDLDSGAMPDALAGDILAASEGMSCFASTSRGSTGPTVHLRPCSTGRNRTCPEVGIEG
jgi:hypothetical protein